MGHWQSPRERRLRWLDDGMMQLSRLDSAIKLGRLEGECKEMHRSQGKEYKYERTPEYRLERHYLREYYRTLRSYK